MVTSHNADPAGTWMVWLGFLSDPVAITTRPKNVGSSERRWLTYAKGTSPIHSCTSDCSVGLSIRAGKVSRTSASASAFGMLKSPHGGHAQSVWHSKRECSDQIVGHRHHIWIDERIYTIANAQGTAPMGDSKSCRIVVRPTARSRWAAAARHAAAI